MIVEDYTPTVAYGESALFARVCPNCNRFVKPDEEILMSDEFGIDEKSTNATCSKCGRIIMPFMGFF